MRLRQKPIGMLGRRSIAAAAASMVLALAVVLILPGRAAGAAEDLTGAVCVADGDTVYVGGTKTGGHCAGGTRLDFIGIDAFELGQTCTRKNGQVFDCGAYAAQRLAHHIQGRPVRCDRHGARADGTPLAECFIGRESLSDYMINHGLALAVHVESSLFIGQDEFARISKKGLWNTRFIPPWDWRRAQGKAR